jgi:hypothetical protein
MIFIPQCFEANSKIRGRAKSSVVVPHVFKIMRLGKTNSEDSLRIIQKKGGGLVKYVGH